MRHNNPQTGLSPIKVLKRLKIIHVEDIEPHEEYIDKYLIAIKNDIKTQGILKDPILADSSRHLVIDGTHRLLALRELGYEYAPILDFNYLSDDIKLGRWIRIVKSNQEEIFTEIIKEIEMKKTSNKNKLRKYLDQNPITIVYRKNVYICERGKWFEKLKIIDNIIKNQEIEFVEDDRVNEMNRVNNLLIGYKFITRKEILEIFNSGYKLSYKSTRHIPPFRVVGVNIPISILNDLERAKEYISSLKLKYIGRNVMYEGRMYSEAIFKPYCK